MSQAPILKHDIGLSLAVVLPPTAAIGATRALWTLPADLATEARICLLVTGLALIGWVTTCLRESRVALAAEDAMRMMAVGQRLSGFGWPDESLRRSGITGPPFPLSG